jgi:plasmid stabilization system protein ParE
MARIELAPGVLKDFDRIIEHLEAFEVDDVPDRVSEIVDGIQILARHPLIGRPVRGGKRELVIGQGSRGHVALYCYLTGADTGFVLAVRSQREAGYATAPRR